jgi:hypothetical protein
MKIYSKYNIYGYFIAINIGNIDYINDSQIWGLLDISFEEYKKFLINNNAYLNFCNNLYFKTKEDCNNCIEKLKKKYSDNLICLTLIGRINYL